MAQNRRIPISKQLAYFSGKNNDILYWKESKRIHRYIFDGLAFSEDETVKGNDELLLILRIDRFQPFNNGNIAYQL